jgi:hypothetical protein
MAVPTLAEYTRVLDTAPHVAVLTGTSSPEQGAGMSEYWPGITAAVSAPSAGDVLADLGRLHPGSPAHAVAGVADVLVGVTRDDPAGVLRLRDRLQHLVQDMPQQRALRPHIAVVLIAEDRRGPQAVASMRAVLDHAGLPVTVAGYLAHDPGALEALLTGRTGARVDRSLLLRSARQLATTLTAQTDTANPAGSASPTTLRSLATPAPLASLPSQPPAGDGPLAWRRFVTLARSR